MTQALLKAAHRAVSLSGCVERSRQFDTDLARYRSSVEPELSTVDCSDVLTGNADLEASCDWIPTTVMPGTTPLPIYPTPFDLMGDV